MSSFLSIVDYSLPNLDKITVPDLIVVTPPSATFNWVTPAVSLICAVAGAYAAWRIGSKAREITAQQRDIAAQAKQIAQEKLDADVFDKRCISFLTVVKIYNTLIKKDFKNISELNDFMTEVYNESIPPNFLFCREDNAQIQLCITALGELQKFRQNNLNVDQIYSDYEKKIKISLFKSQIQDTLLPEFKNILSKYVPVSMVSSPSRLYSTNHPASPDMPPPAAPAADQ